MQHNYETPEVRLVLCKVENSYVLSHRNPDTSDSFTQLDEFHNTSYNYGDEIF